MANCQSAMAIETFHGYKGEWPGLGEPKQGVIILGISTQYIKSLMRLLNAFLNILDNFFLELSN